MHLGVNIDHVATLREARYRTMRDSHNAEPSVLAAARTAELAGADSITAHLRADRRHMQDADIDALKNGISTKLNFEMGNTPEIVSIALRMVPDFACLVPENREEVTTEGGLDVVGQLEALRRTVGQLQAIGTKVSLFIDPEPEQIEAAATLRVNMIELHTGTFANVAPGALRDVEAKKLADAAVLAHEAGIQVNAGHGLTTENLPDLWVVPHLAELNIGHHLVARSVFVGLAEAVKEIREVMDTYPQ